MCIIGAAPALPAGTEFPAMYPDSAEFERALRRVPAFPEARTHSVTGIVVPHHLAAAELMALGFRAAEGRDLKRIILLSPDHFKRSRSPVATTRRGFETAWGGVPVDTEAVRSLLAGKAPVSDSALFAKEHGVHALLPFIARLFPDASIVPVAIRIDSKIEDWDLLVDELVPLVNDSTLIVQSTDFSHYLGLRKARLHDQETMNTLALGDARSAAALRQPDHLDSRAAQYVHMTLQRRLGHRGHCVIGNRNSQDGSVIHQATTTSYVVQVFEKEQAHGWPARAGEEVWYFGGDTFFGRNVLPLLSKPERFEEVIGRITRITGGAPLVVNLEGIMIPRVADPHAQRPLAMPEDFALKCLRTLNVRAVGLANNHSLDLGPRGLEHTVDFLRNSGIEPFVHGETLDLGKFRIIGLTDLVNESHPRLDRLGEREISKITGSLGNGKPGIAFVHWGEEWKPELQPRQEKVLGWLTAPVGGKTIVEDGREMTYQPSRGSLALVIGAHPHEASLKFHLRAGRRVLVAPSIGNLIFDQPQGDGSLVEVRFFPCGTHATRLIPIGNTLSR